MPQEDTVASLYRERGYPPMSHPATDPAFTAASARLAGLATPDPRGASILEIGCASGHNLLPLAARWREAEITGCDISAAAVEEAMRLAMEAGLGNAKFLTADLRDLEFPGKTFDYIIAHGVFSWVEDDAKKALLDFCARHLSPDGIAVISFNVWAGWEARLHVAAAVGRIEREHGVDRLKAIAILREVVEDETVRAIADDMLLKGAEILSFDDFGPVNDPWAFDRFVSACASLGLRWLGESDPAENFPHPLTDEQRASLAPLAGDPLAMHTKADELARRTFRSGMICRADAPVAARVSTATVMDLCVHLPKEPVSNPEPVLKAVLDVLGNLGPGCFPVPELAGKLPEMETPVLARTVFQAITRGNLRARIEPIRIGGMPDICRLDAFRSICAREGLPVVDAWHSPCVFSEKPLKLLGEIDGRRMEDAAALAAEICPDLAFPVWLDHLVARGLLDSR